MVGVNTLNNDKLFVYFDVNFDTNAKVGRVWSTEGFSPIRSA